MSYLIGVKYDALGETKHSAWLEGETVSEPDNTYILTHLKEKLNDPLTPEDIKEIIREFLVKNPGEDYLYFVYAVPRNKGRGA